MEAADGKEVIGSTEYNLRGQKIVDHPAAESTFAAGGWDGTSSSYTTTHAYDGMGRQVTKTVLRNPALFSVSGDPTSTSNYTYTIENGFQRTDIAIASLGKAIAASRTYDRIGHLLKTTQHVGGNPGRDVTAQYRYDEQGKVVDIIDSAGNTISATYDDLGRKLTMSDPDKGASSYQWDGLGRLLQETDAKSQESDYTYDTSGRKRSRTVNGTLVASWTYDDPTGTLTSESGDEDGYLRTYTYDALLRPSKVTTHVPASTSWAARDFTVQYAYDGLYDREKEMQYPSGELVAYDYDQRGFARGESQVGFGGTRIVTYRSVDLTQPHRIKQQQLGNGVNELVLTDETSGLVQFMRASTGQAPATPGALVHCSDAMAASIRCTDYSYDGLANLASQTKHFYPVVNSAVGTVYATATESYQYDDLQRLTAESRSYASFTPVANTALSETYSYNGIGNITAKSDFGLPYAYGDKTRPSDAGPHAVLTVGSPAVWSYQYDLNGNMTSDGHRTVAYDDQDRPNQITLGGVTTIFKYSPDGERYLQRTVSSDGSANRTIYYVDKRYERVDWDSKPNEERTYCGPSVVIEQKGGFTGTREVRYLHLDRLGSTDAATGDGGTELLDDAHGFDAFGRPRGRDWQPSADQMHPNGEWGTTTNHGFTGHEQLDETFLTHMNGRVYDYRLGRFLTVDPVIGDPANSQSINPYSYVGNNPLNLIDPTGYSPCDPDTSSAFSQCENHTINGPGPFNVAANNQAEQARNGASTTNGGSAANTSSAPSNTNSTTQVAQQNKPADEMSPGEKWSREASSDTTVVNGTRGQEVLQLNLMTRILLGGGRILGGLVCEASVVCGIALGVVVVGGIAYLYLRNDQSEPVTATDASGALNPGPQAPTMSSGTSEAPNARGGVYVLKDPDDDTVMKSGRTNDLGRRERELARNPIYQGLDFTAVHRTDNYVEQRGLEQILHENFKPPLDRINGVNPDNPNATTYRKAAEEFLRKQGGDGRQ